MQTKRNIFRYIIVIINYLKNTILALDFPNRMSEIIKKIQFLDDLIKMRVEFKFNQGFNNRNAFFSKKKNRKNYRPKLFFFDKFFVNTSNIFKNYLYDKKM